MKTLISILPSIFRQLTTFLKLTFKFYVIGLIIISISSAWDIFYGTDLFHPIWQQDYNWTPLLTTLIYAAAAGSVAYIVMPSLIVNTNKNMRIAVGTFAMLVTMKFKKQKLILAQYKLDTSTNRFTYSAQQNS